MLKCVKSFVLLHDAAPALDGEGLDLNIVGEVCVGLVDHQADKGIVESNKELMFLCQRACDNHTALKQMLCAHEHAEAFANTNEGVGIMTRQCGILSCRIPPIRALPTSKKRKGKWVATYSGGN